jgi:hypothetical protein
MDNKYKIIIYVLLCLILVHIIYLIINYSYSEYFTDNIYVNFKKSLNSINKKVRKSNFTYYETDKKIVNWAINKLKSYNCNIYIHNKIYYGHPDLEFNYSHTMSDHIILSNTDYNLLKRYYNDDNDNVIFSVGLTIVHESLHVHQRFNYEKYKELYKMWGYVFVPKIYNFNHILKTKRQNPDANDNNILWYNSGKYYFINCFFDKNNVDSKVVNRLAYPIVKDDRNNFKYKNESPISIYNMTNYNNYFGKVHNDYTPNEICAEYNEKLYLECVNEYDTFISPAYTIFKNWYINNVF